MSSLSSRRRCCHRYYRRFPCNVVTDVIVFVSVVVVVIVFVLGIVDSDVVVVSDVVAVVVVASCSKQFVNYFYKTSNLQIHGYKIGQEFYYLLMCIFIKHYALTNNLFECIVGSHILKY